MEIVRKLLNKNFLLASMLFLGLLIPAQAQTDRMLVELADEMFEFGDYEDALGIYLQATIENPENLRANFMAGRCYLRTTSEKPEAVEFFKKAYEINPEVHPNILFYIAEGYRFGYKFDKAIEYYKKYAKELDVDRRKFADKDIEELKKRTERRIEVCNNAKGFVNDPIKIDIGTLGPVVNSRYDDYAPTISRDDKILIFTSRREGGSSVLKDVDNKYFEDIYITEWDGTDWSSPENIGEPVNSEQHDSNIGMSPNGERLYIYKTENGGDIYVSEKKNDKWGSPKALDDPINSEYRETSAYEVSDNLRMFFSSDRPDGKGGLDIYLATKDSKGRWKNVEALPDVINTKYDEESPYFDEETNTLYFSSKGHNGMGNHDIFMSKYDPDTETWETPENLGFPINTSDDDLFFVLSSDSETAYYSSFKDDSEGGLDIYKIYPFEKAMRERKMILEETVVKEDTVEAPEVIPPAEVLLPVAFELNVYDQQTDAPVNAKVSIIKMPEDNIASKGEAIDGKYTFEFLPEIAGDYMATLEAEGYLYQTVKFSIKPLVQESEIIKNVALRRPKEKVINVLRNIYFEFDEFTLKPESHNELDQLTAFLEQSPNVKIEIAGHTDFIGSNDYNYQLSKKRAQAVKDYLVNHGIDTSRLTIKGYGKTQPLASNDDETEGRELNRRTEFIIISQ